jgi:hypothetical protein
MSGKSKAVLRHLFSLSQHSLRVLDRLVADERPFDANEWLFLVGAFIKRNRKLQSTLVFKDSLEGYSSTHQLDVFLQWMTIEPIVLRNHPFSSVHRLIGEFYRSQQYQFQGIERGQESVTITIGECDAVSLPKSMSCIDAHEHGARFLRSAVEGLESVQRAHFTVIESRNERYSHLFTLGLDPEKWLWSSSITTPQLKDLSVLRRSVNRLLRSGVGGGNTKTAWHEAFSVRLGEKGSVAGFRSLDEFLLSEVGQELTGVNFIPYDELNEGIFAGEGQEEGSGVLERVFMGLTEEQQQRFARLVASEKKIEPLERYFLIEVLLGSSANPLHSVEHSAMWYESVMFDDLWKESPQYVTLETKAQVLAKLQGRVQGLFKKWSKVSRVEQAAASHLRVV